MATPKEIVRLVETFERNIESYRQAPYNEAQLRRQFIDPFFKTLGWDMDNEQGWAEAYKEVIHEDSIRIGQSTKAPDYCFRIGGARKFFLEAKKPSVNIKDDPTSAYQLRRYAWSAKLPLSILMDFEEFAVYDCRVRPHKSDKPSKARVKYFKYTDYIERWDEIAAIFSRDAILKGSFDKYAQTEKRKRGTAEVDTAFLAEIEEWREKLARNIALRNDTLTNRQLNYAVQITIDRVVFLRICEDRGIERYGQLMGLLNGRETYQRLMAVFRRADDRYNSGLFHFMPEKDRSEGPDELTPELVIDDKPLKEILRSLYYPDSPYEFSVLPAEILGQVYEQFLGKVITLTAGHHARIEDKPEVKKAGGVYYTPSYIVDYIVKHTVGRLLEGASVKRLKTKPPRLDRTLRVLDPACGSGSFLLGAYQTLLDWYRDYYENNEPDKWAPIRHPPIYQAGRFGWKLTLAERKRILLDHIYGVDIDTQAVEVTKLSLLLRVLEGEKDLVLFHHERALPDLAANIKCGNSLIGPDFYQGHQLAMFDEDERLRINAFNWHAEFRQIFEDGGFDVVIGNPPYVRQESLGDQKQYYNDQYRTFRPTADLYIPFIEKGLSLLKQQGRFGMIVSNKWLRASYGQGLRTFLMDSASVDYIVDFAGLPVFTGATVRAVILLCRPFCNGKSISYCPPMDSETFHRLSGATDIDAYVPVHSYKVEKASLSPQAWSLIHPDYQSVVSRLYNCSMSLTQYIGRLPLRGIITGLNAAFVINRRVRKELLDNNPESEEIIKPLLVGKNVRRYSVTCSDRFLILTRVGVDMKRYPAVLTYLNQFKTQLEKRWDKGNHWWELRPCDYYDYFEHEKIIYPDISTTCRFHLDTQGFYSTNTTYFIPKSDTFLLGILNSSTAMFYFSTVCAGLEGAGTNYLRFFGQYMQNFPVPNLTHSNVAIKSRKERLISFVGEMLHLHRNLKNAKTPNVKNAIERQIDATDRQIDQLVYELYGLTEDEIAIVEDAYTR